MSAIRRVRGRRWVWLVAAGVVLALVGGLVGWAIGRGRSRDTAGGCDAVAVARTVLPSVVTVAVTGATAAGTGSGAIIRGDGYVLTNAHVIAAALGGGSVTVVLSDGEQLPATIVGSAELVDLAVLRVSAGRALPTIGAGSSAALRVGEPVVALGSPLGLTGTVTAGIVSALGRDVTLPSTNGTAAVLAEAVQTDAAINPGNSGGPLVDCAGRLVGVNTAGAVPPGGAGSAGLGFAIPADFARRVADQIIATGRFTPAVLGLSAVPVPAALAQQLGGQAGLVVRSVQAQGPAAQAGLAVGDVIVEIDGAAVSTGDDLLKVIVTHHPGDRLTVGYLRAGQHHTTTLVLG
jgi:putative serine protease PepD